METKNTQPAITTKQLFAREEIQKKFQELLGSRAPQFITSVLQIAASTHLSGADPMSVYNAAAMAATLDLPLNASLGFAYIVPYNEKQSDGSYKKVAQFQIGAKGYRQLALRTGLFVAINTSDVREGEIKSRNRLTGKIEFDWIQEESDRLNKKIIGYVSYFELQNGYSHTLYMSIDKLTEHGAKYSKSFDNKFGLWKTDFGGMCTKTVLKMNLSKNAPLSVEMRTAINVDQSVINNSETEDVKYVDASQKTFTGEEKDPLEKTTEEAIEVKKADDLTPHTDAISSDAGTINSEIEDKEKLKNQKHKQGRLM